MLRIELHNLFWFAFYKVIAVSNKHSSIRLLSINFFLSCNKKKFHKKKLLNSVGSMTRVDPICCILNVLFFKYVFLRFFTKSNYVFIGCMSSFEWAKLTRSCLTTPKRFNLKYGLDKESGWEVLKLIHRAEFNDIVKKIQLPRHFFNIKKTLIWPTK